LKTRGSGFISILPTLTFVTLFTYLPSAFGAGEACSIVFSDLESQRNAKIAHDSITADLFSGEIIEVRRFNENDNKHALFMVKIRATDPYTGNVRYREAFFKPRVWGDEDGWARTPMEYVGYFLNLRLKMDYVPPTAYRRGLNIEMDGQKFTEGSLLIKASGFRPVASFPNAKFPISHDGIISDNRILNVIMQNQDGHTWNMGTAKHWVDGKEEPIFLDFAGSMRQGTNVSMTNYPAFGNTAPVTKVRASTLLALRQLNKADLQPLVSAGFISDGESNQMLNITKGIVAYFDGLIGQAKQKGKLNEVLLDE